MHPSARREIGFSSALYGPSETLAWIAVAYIALAVRRLQMTPGELAHAYLYLFVLAVFFISLFHWLLPAHSAWPWARRIGIIGAILLLAWASLIFAPFGLHVDLFYVAVIAVAGIIAGRRMALGAALLAFALDIATTLISAGPSAAFTVFLPLKLLLYLAAGYVALAQTGLVRQRAQSVTRRNTELGFLLDTSAIATSSLDLDAVFPQLAQRVADALPATYCRICLLDQDQGTLSTRGSGISRESSIGDRPATQDQTWLLIDMPRLHETMASAHITCIHKKELIPDDEKEREALFPGKVGTVCIVPVVAQGTTLGAIIVGDDNSALPDPFEQRKRDLLQALAAQVGVVVQNGRLYENTERQSKRFAVLVEVGRVVGSTLETNDLLELVHQQVTKTLPSDTYFVALYDEKEGIFDIRILYDGGQRFPPQQIRLGEGLATWVILKRQPLLVRKLSDEMDSLPVKPITLGLQSRSESWLGVPIMTQGAILGLLAVASYTPYAFDEDDMALLSTVAQQTALALDNARHHAQVQDQARRDSLTGVYNHGHFLALLQEQLKACAEARQPISVIMLDVDHFKLYNDQYGHVVGDAVLRLTAQAVRTHIKKTDAVGRWGGEEFAVVLPGASTAVAQMVAQRIRSTLTGLPLAGSDGQPIPKPTVSQGIATFPDHVSNAEDLVVAADRALYEAKGAGRDQVSVASTPPAAT